MENSWPPSDAPPVKKDLEKVNQQTASKEKLKPVTKAELKQLEAERKTAKPQQQLVPKGVQVPKSQDEVKREKRIADMRERLNRVRGRCQDDFTRKM